MMIASPFDQKQTIINRMDDAQEKGGPQGVQEEGIDLELIEGIRTKQGVHGLHIMPVGWEDVIPRIVTEANLLPKGFVKSKLLKESTYLQSAAERFKPRSSNPTYKLQSKV